MPKKKSKMPGPAIQKPKEAAKKKTASSGGAGAYKARKGRGKAGNGKRGQ